MSGLAEIVQGYAAIKREEAVAVLATVVKAKGSVQQAVGTRMLIREDHSTVGSCFNAELHNFVVGRALETLASHQTMRVVFEVGSTAKNGSAPGTTSFGVIHVLLEPLPFSARSSHLRFIDDCLRSRTTGVVASVFPVGRRDQSSCRLARIPPRRRKN